MSAHRMRNPMLTRCVWLSLLGWPLVAAAQPCQLFVSRGEARITGSGGEVRLVKSSAGVLAGESVVAASATTVAFLRSRTRVDRLEARAALSCPAPGDEPGAATQVARLIDHLLAQATVPSKPAGYRGSEAADGSETLRVLYPAHDSRILGSSTGFAWNLAGDAFVITLRDRSDRVVWTRWVAGSNSLPYPADAAPLAPDERYVWSVAAAGNEQQRASAAFSTASVAQRQDVEQRVAAARRACLESRTRAADCALAAAGLLAQAGYASDALVALTAGLRDAHQDKTIVLLLGQLLALQYVQNER